MPQPSPAAHVLIPETREGYVRWQKRLCRCDVMGVITVVLQTQCNPGFFVNERRRQRIKIRERSVTTAASLA